MSRQLERMPSNICALPALSVVIVVCAMPSGAKMRARANAATSRPVASASTRSSVCTAELLYAHSVPGAASCPRPIANAVRSGAASSRR